MLDQLSDARLAMVHPALSIRIHNLADALTVNIRVTAGIRSVAQQDALYAQGRTVPGEIVTDAQGTQSNHIYGFAADLCVMTDGKPDWSQSPWIALAPSYSLRSGIG